MKRLLFFIGIATTLNGFADAVPAGSEDEIRERIAPFGEVCVVGNDCGGVDASAQAAAQAASSAGGAPGSRIYDIYCFACHAAGVGGAPKFGNADDWAPRLAQGMDVVMNNTRNGLGALMPAKGTCMDCSDADLQAAVDYMSGRN